MLSLYKQQNNTLLENSQQLKQFTFKFPFEQ